MAKSIQISKREAVWVPHTQSHRMIVKTANPEEMPGEVFIKQRLKNFAQDSWDDRFVAICTPVQLEDFPTGSPDARSSYYRTDEIELIARTPEELNRIFDSLLYEVEKLVIDLNAMADLAPAQIYNVTPQGTILT